jgi:hypothetical protein
LSQLGSQNLCHKSFQRKIYLLKKKFAIAKINENLIRRFALILQAITSGAEINISNYSEYGKETSE